MVRIYHVNGGIVSFLTFTEFLSKEGLNIESIAELKPNHLASLWMLYVSFLEEKNLGYRDLFQQFFDPPQCSLVQSFLNKCTNACHQIKFIVGIYEDGYAKIRQIQWDHRLPEDECIPICKPLSVDESPKTKGDVHCEGFLVFVLPRLQQATKPIHYAKQTAIKTAGQKNHAEMKWLNHHQKDILSQFKKTSRIWQTNFLPWPLKATLTPQNRQNSKRKKLRQTSLCASKCSSPSNVVSHAKRTLPR
jgi:hypothetical protein